MPERVASADPDGVDYTWVMQMTFVAALAVGVPVVVVASLGRDLPTWTDKALFAVRTGAVVWLLVAVVVYGYARTKRR